MSDERERTEATAEQRRISGRMVVFLVVMLLVVLLGVDNRQSVQVGYLFDETDIPLVWVIVGALVAGAILERTYGFVRARRDRD